MGHVSRVLLGVGGLVLLLILLVAAATAWLRSQAALDFAIDQIRSRTAGAVTIQDATGSLLSRHSPGGHHLCRCREAHQRP